MNMKGLLLVGFLRGNEGCEIETTKKLDMENMRLSAGHCEGLSISLPSQIIDLIHETYSIYAHSIQKLVGRNQLYAKQNTENRFHLPRRTPKRKKKVSRKTYLPAPESLARAPPQALAAVGTRT